MENWSKVLGVVKSIKSELNNLGIKIEYSSTVGSTCVERWVSELDNSSYNNMFKYLQFSQVGDNVLFRYARYSDVFSGESDVNYHDFWDIYDGFYCECRSIVIDVRNEVVVISPFDKFFNVNENPKVSEDQIRLLISNCKSLEISEKLDGSMQCARYYNGGIVMSSSQSLDIVNSWRLNDGFRMLNSCNNYIRMIKMHPDLTFIFEYISLADAHVVNYTVDQEGLYLIGIRNSITGEQYSYTNLMLFVQKFSVKHPKLFNKTFNEVMSELDLKKSNEAEGFVLNIDGFMVKLKYIDYISVHKILSNISSIGLIIKNIGDNTFDDLLSKVPEVYKWRVYRVSNIIFSYIKDTNEKLENYFKQIEEMEFVESMKWIQRNAEREYRGYLIEMKKGNKDINYIKSKNGSYKKLKHMGVAESDYTTIFKLG